jgi:hypothetical protein
MTRPTIDIWLPTYHRSGKLATVAKNIEKTTKNNFVLYFGVEPDDDASWVAALRTGHQVVYNSYAPGYAGAVQTMYEVSKSPFWIHANDDFEFLPDWDVVPLSMFDAPHIMVVGVREQEHSSFSAVFMARRSYIEKMSGVIGMPNRVLYPYHHNYVDTEFTETAKARGVWAKCDAPCILHKHPGIIGGDKDETYRKNDATVAQDEETFHSREHLWKNYNKESDRL